MVSDDAIPCFVSVVSFFEIAIKKKIGKLKLTRPVSAYLSEVEKIGIQILPVSGHYLDTYQEIALRDNHRDPFDRLIIATALSEKLTVISSDEQFKFYKDFVDVVW
ncbi:PIN domain-containing protein [Dyadobacter sandarakinus]|uniref:PIN domain-containing protein n=1 Tax=Dyadobacter sandarakinus TaxID=2747268 RepID=A0ABX7IDS9_9BACT|nr:PIN domain-containing protein [Dyadobacter sandarakinus]